MAQQAPVSSKLNGAPTLEVNRDRIRLVQRRHFGWILVGFPVVFVSAFLISEYSKKSAFRREPWAYLLHTIESFAWFEWIALGIAFFLFLVSVISGLLYALWTRELDIDLARKRFRFCTGLVGRLTTIERSTEELTTLRLKRLTATGNASYGPDRTYEYWSLDLEIPGGVEPLNIGQWGRYEEALDEARRWQQWLPTLKLQPGN